MNKKKIIGNHYESIAETLLLDEGYRIIAKNYSVAKVGELDLVALDEHTPTPTLLFVEVRARHSNAFGGALASVTPSKQKRLITTVQQFLLDYPEYTNHTIRFDVIAFDISTKQSNWVCGAFLADEYI